MNNKLYIDGLQIVNAVEDSNRLNIEGYCCHFNTVNLNNEIVDEKSFDTFFNMYKEGKLSPKLNWNHEENYIGGITSIEVGANGLYINAFVDKNIKIVDEMIAPNILNGVLNQFSTEGFIQGGYNGIVEHEDGSYYVKDFLLTNVSIVAHPADSDAKFTLKNFINEYNSKWFLM